MAREQVELDTHKDWASNKRELHATAKFRRAPLFPMPLSAKFTKDVYDRIGRGFPGEAPDVLGARLNHAFQIQTTRLHGEHGIRPSFDVVRINQQSRTSRHFWKTSSIGSYYRDSQHHTFQNW